MWRKIMPNPVVASVNISLWRQSIILPSGVFRSIPLSCEWSANFPFRVEIVNSSFQSNCYYRCCKPCTVFQHTMTCQFLLQANLSRCFLWTVTILTTRTPSHSIIPTTRLDCSAAGPRDRPHVTKEKTLLDPYNSGIFTAIHRPNVCICHLIAGFTSLLKAPGNVHQLQNGVGSWWICSILCTNEPLQIFVACHEIYVILLYHQRSTQVSEGHQNQMEYRRNSKS